MNKTQTGYPFEFDSTACERCIGKCCIGESGYIWISRQEQIALAEHLGLDMSAFQEKHIDRYGGKESLKEVSIGKDNYACEFFDVQRRQCTIYEFRPTQCRTFPFWPYFKKNPKMVQEECPGIEIKEENF